LGQTGIDSILLISILGLQICTYGLRIRTLCAHICDLCLSGASFIPLLFYLCEKVDVILIDSLTN